MGDRARHRELGAVFPQVDRQPSGRHLRHSRHRAARSHARQPCRRPGADARRRDAPEDAAALRGAMTNIVWAAVLALLSSLPMTAAAAGGRLVDQDGQSVANAWFVATREECIGFAHCNTHSVEVKVAKTDARGNFSVNTGLRPLNDYAPMPYGE